MSSSRSKVSPLTLDQQRAEFASAKFLAMPIAGTIAWAVVGAASLVLSTQITALVLFAATGSIFYLGLLVAKITGEDLLGKTRPGNLFDRLFLLSIGMACLVYAIAIPFFLIEPTSLPLTVGILTGLMWLPFSGIIQHWVGYFHAAARTVLIVAVWYLFPEYRFLSVSLVIIVIYAVTISALHRRRRVVGG